MFFLNLKYNRVTLKLLGLLFLLIFLWIVNLLVPVHVYNPIAYPMIYPFRLLFICYSIVILFSIHVIRNRKVDINNHHIIMGFILGALGGSTDIFLAVTTVLAYISSIIMLGDSKAQIHFIKTPIKDPLYIIITIVFLYVIFYIRFNEFGLIPVSYGLFRALKPGITEEVMWRLFLFSVAMKITKGKFTDKYHKIIIIIILTLPFALLHEPNNYDKLGNPINYINLSNFIGITFAAVILTWTFLKKGLFCAILLHFFYNAYNYSYALYAAGDDIFYYIQPSIIDVVFSL